MVNINIEIPDEIYKKVKLSAVMADKTVKDYVIARIDENLRRNQ